uniref:TetR/AcrR family transcriptional regulator n=2 Tax=Nocardioides campestrisoli TaxID=2736757 RepID=UPI002159D3AE|nr:TetR/AcrR family transcriptional regulator [Nocardioides campestrisoli]
MSAKKKSPRMTGTERREQLVEVARGLFAERGFDGTAIEEVATRAGVSKPVVYEHFGGKEGLYAVVVDREVTQLLTTMRDSLTNGTSRELLQSAAAALLDFVEANPDGFRILVRDSPIGASSSSFRSIIGDVTSRVEGILMTKFKEKELDPRVAPMYAQMLVGMVAMVGQWWLDTREPAKEVVAAHLVNLAWNGLSGMERDPHLLGD